MSANDSYKTLPRAASGDPAQRPGSWKGRDRPGGENLLPSTEAQVREHFEQQARRDDPQLVATERNTQDIVAGMEAVMAGHPVRAAVDESTREYVHGWAREYRQAARLRPLDRLRGRAYAERRRQERIDDVVGEYDGARRNLARIRQAFIDQADVAAHIEDVTP